MFGDTQTGQPVELTLACDLASEHWSHGMTDAYVFLFRRIDSNGVAILSTRRATLEAIKSHGEPVMETQIVVDRSEIDELGFFAGNARQNANAEDLLYKQIRSLICRADLRDLAIKDLHENQNLARYMLELESRELRKQAITLQQLSADIAGLARSDRQPGPSEKMGEHSSLRGN